jgi:hypothetical protein
MGFGNDRDFARTTRSKKTDKCKRRAALIDKIEPSSCKWRKRGFALAEREEAGSDNIKD